MEKKVVIDNHIGKPYEITVRLANSDDVDKIIMLLHLCYGDLCSDTSMYDKHILAYDITTGKKNIVVAEKDKEIIALESCCDDKYFEKTILLKTQITAPAYRKAGVNKAIVDYIFTEFDLTHWNSAYAYAITNNSVSQHTSIAKGFEMTGMIFNSFMASELLSAGDNCSVPKPKRTHAVIIKNILLKEVGDLFVPTYLHQIFRAVYNTLKVKFTLVGDADTPPIYGESTQYVFLDNAFHHNCEIIVNRVGSDLNNIVHTIESKHGKNPLQTYNLFLNSKDKDAIAGFHILSKLGYVFTGIKPLGNNAEYLIMYHSENVKIDTKNCLIHPYYQEIAQNFFDLLHN